MEAIRRDSDATAPDGCLVSTNARFYYTGEVRRRNGMIHTSNKSAYSVTGFWTPSGGNFAILVTPTGGVESVAL